MQIKIEDYIKDSTHLGKIIVAMPFGSVLYGTNTAKSDSDYKGVFIPRLTDLLLNKVPKSLRFNSGKEHEKNTSEDVDIELYSLHYFLELALKGETVSLDMLHARKDQSLTWTDIWNDLHENRKLFYTKDLSAFVGYARRQASKYGVKGSRLSTARKILQWMRDSVENWQHTNPYGAPPRISELTESFSKEILEHVIQSDEWVEVCGKKMLWKARITEYLPTMELFVSNYGERARQAEKSENVDWKAVSHAFRAAYEVKHILVNGGFSFPLPETSFIMQVKAGELSYPEVAARLDSLIEELEVLSECSTLPKKPDRKYWENWLIRTTFISTIGEVFDKFV